MAGIGLGRLGWACSLFQMIKLDLKWPWKCISIFFHFFKGYRAVWMSFRRHIYMTAKKELYLLRSLVMKLHFNNIRCLSDILLWQCALDNNWSLPDSYSQVCIQNTKKQYCFLISDAISYLYLTVFQYQSVVTDISLIWTDVCIQINHKIHCIFSPSRMY